MSYEDKIRDLLERLVAMTPEPPPNPEEITMTRRAIVRRPRPMLIFAGAAALVALLAVPIILLGGRTGGEVVDTTTSTLVSPTTIVPSETTTTTPTVGITWSGYVYVYQMPQNSFKNDPALVPILVVVDVEDGDEDANFSDALAQMTRDGSLPEPFQNSIPEAVRVINTSIDGSVLTVEMNEAFLDGAGGLLADFTMLNQLIYQLTHQGLEDLKVLFTVNSEPITEFGTDGLDLSQPVGRDTFIDDLALIFVTSPIVESQGAYHVAGVSNTFEAVLALRVLDGSGEVVHEQFIQATDGSGTWGTYEATVDANLIVPGESSIMLFSYSPEGGDRLIDVIEVPIPVDDVWNLTGRPEAVTSP